MSSQDSFEIHDFHFESFEEMIDSVPPQHLYRFWLDMTFLKVMNTATVYISLDGIAVFQSTSDLMPPIPMGRQAGIVTFIVLDSVYLPKFKPLGHTASILFINDDTQESIEASTRFWTSTAEPLTVAGVVGGISSGLYLIFKK